MNNKDVDNIGIPVLQKRGLKRMKVVKAQCLLYIFNMLKDNGYIKKEDVLNNLEISELTFWRYIQEIKAFICNFNYPYEIVYERKEDAYFLRKIVI